jgi:Tat protein translocase TatB subunit
LFLFIFESIGTSELILIGIVALIFLGPRRLPEIAKKMGKMMADFRNTTQEFKSTWENEVKFDEEAEALRTGELPAADEQPVPRVNSILNPESGEAIAAPEIKQIDKDEFDSLANSANVPPESADADVNQTSEADDKRNWL